MDWTEKHRPLSLADIVGNGPSVKRLLDWGREWQQGVPEKRAIVLAGPPGTGKTSAALALARDMGWTAIELNASDARNAAAIQKVATAGAVHQTFAADGTFRRAGDEAGRKLIILDEADNLYERLSGENAAGGGSDLSDRGGKVQIVQTIRDTKQPIILIVNDLYSLQKGSGSALRSLTETLKWARINVRSIPKALATICGKEQIQVDREVLEAIAGKAEGDLRAAVRDLESICMGRSHVTVRELESIGQRDTTGNMFDVVRHVLKGQKIATLRREVQSVDATPEDLVLWVDENLAKEYAHPEDLVAGYEMLSRADVFLGRTRRTQNYRLWAYASDLSTAGVMASKQHPGAKGFTPFGFPQWLMKMSRSRGVRATKDKLASNLGRATHQSKRKARLWQVEPFTTLFAQDEEFQVHQAFALDLADDDVAALLGTKPTAAAVKRIREGAEELAEQAPAAAAPAGGLGSFGALPVKPGPGDVAEADAQGGTPGGVGQAAQRGAKGAGAGKARKAGSKAGRAAGRARGDHGEDFGDDGPDGFHDARDGEEPPGADEAGGPDDADEDGPHDAGQADERPRPARPRAPDPGQQRLF